MFLTNEELKARLDSPDNLINVMSQPDSLNDIRVIKWAGADSTGHVKGQKNLTEEEQIAAGVLSRAVGTEIAADTFGVSRQTVSNISAGNAGYETKDKVDKAMGIVDRTIETVAAEKLLLALGMITEGKLSTCSAKDLSTVAANMSKAVSNARPVDKGSNGPKVNIIIHQPKRAEEEHFEMIQVSA